MSVVPDPDSSVSSVEGTEEPSFCFLFLMDFEILVIFLFLPGCADTEVCKCQPV